MKKISLIILLVLCSITYAKAGCFNETTDKKKDFLDCLEEAEQGDDRTQSVVAGMYYEGEGTTQDYKEALKWYRKSAEEGNSFSYTTLGDMYRKGEGTAQDYKEALQWFRKGAERGDSRAQAMLGVMYYFGKGIAQDYVMAHMYVNLAAANGDKNARELRDELANKMTSSQIEQAQKLAREWMSKH